MRWLELFLAALAAVVALRLAGLFLRGGAVSVLRDLHWQFHAEAEDGTQAIGFHMESEPEDDSPFETTPGDPAEEYPQS